MSGYAEQISLVLLPGGVHMYVNLTMLFNNGRMNNLQCPFMVTSNLVPINVEAIEPLHECNNILLLQGVG